uniref:Uncharacterized protein n=1 Tax=Onchocerca volvulus TaxID=6282 RepID=A0A8R1TIM6_ONCVO
MDGTLIWPTNATNYNLSKQTNPVTNNTVEIRTDLQTEPLPLSGPFRIVDIRFTAPPLYPFGLTGSDLPQETRKQSILLNGGTRKFKNGRKIFSEDSAETTDQRNANLLESKATDFWSENFQRSKNTGYQIDEAKLIAMNRPKIFSGSENQRYEQDVKLANSRKGAKPIFSLRETEGDSNDSDLVVMNLKSDYHGILTPKPIISPMQFINGINDRMKYENQKYTGYLNLNPGNFCPPGTTTSNQPWNPWSSIAQSGKIWTSTNQLPNVMNRFLTSASQYQPNYQQNPTTWDTASVIQEPIDQFVAPITPVNNHFDNSVQMTLSNRNNSWMMPNRATPLDRSWHLLNGIQIPVHPIYTGYTESSPPEIPLSNVPSIARINPASNEVNFYNRLLMLPTMTAMKSNYQKIDAETDDYNSKKEQKDSKSRIHLEKDYPINRELKTSLITDLMENRRSLIPASESLISS